MGASQKHFMQHGVLSLAWQQRPGQHIIRRPLLVITATGGNAIHFCFGKLVVCDEAQGIRGTLTSFDPQQASSEAS